MSQVPLPSQASGSLFFPLPRDSAPQAPEMHLGDKGRDSPFLSQACRGSCGSSCCRLAGGPTRSRSACRCYASLAHRGCWPGRCRRGRSTCAAPASPRQRDSWHRARPPTPAPAPASGAPLTRKASLNSNRQGNCLSSWWTESSHCRNTGHCSFWSSAFSWWPQRSPNLCPKSSQSDSTNTWKPCNQEGVRVEGLSGKAAVLPARDAQSRGAGSFREEQAQTWKRTPSHPCPPGKDPQADPGGSVPKLPSSCSFPPNPSQYLQRPVIRVQENLGQRDDLRRAVPAVRAVHQHGPALPVHRVRHEHRRLQHHRQVLQPLGALQSRQPATRGQRSHLSLRGPRLQQSLCQPPPLHRNKVPCKS